MAAPERAFQRLNSTTRLWQLVSKSRHPDLAGDQCWATGQAGLDHRGKRYSSQMQGVANGEMNSVVLLGEP